MANSESRTLLCGAGKAGLAFTPPLTYRQAMATLRSGFSLTPDILSSSLAVVALSEAVDILHLAVTASGSGTLIVKLSLLAKQHWI